MDRTKTDTIIGIVGAVAIVFTLVGVFAYEYNNAPDGLDGGEGEGTGEPPIASETFSGSVASDGSATEEFTPAAGVTSMEISIAWTPATAAAPIDQAATYNWELSGPDGEVIDTGSNTGAETIDVVGPVAGTYTLTISAPSPSQGGDYTVEAAYGY